MRSLVSGGALNISEVYIPAIDFANVANRGRVIRERKVERETS